MDWQSFFNQDPRDYGSHNAGGTNAGRLWGKKIGVLIILIDMLKAIVSLWICWALLTLIPLDGQRGLVSPIEQVNNLGFNYSYVIPWPVYWIATFGCMVGHCWPIFADFKGGKGAAVFIGTLVFSSWLIGFIPCLIYLVILKITKYVSLASITTSISCTIVAWVWALLCIFGVIPPSLYSLPTYGANLLTSWVFAATLTVLTIIIIIRHFSNIKRLKNGTERKITWMK